MRRAIYSKSVILSITEKYLFTFFKNLNEFHLLLSMVSILPEISKIDFLFIPLHMKKLHIK